MSSKKYNIFKLFSLDIFTFLCYNTYMNGRITLEKKTMFLTTQGSDFSRVLKEIQMVPRCKYVPEKRAWRFPYSPINLTHLVDMGNKFGGFSYPPELEEIYLVQKEQDEWVRSLYTDGYAPNNYIFTGKTVPFKHQDIAIDFIVKVKRGLLLDEMGLGKTLAALYGAIHLNAEKVLVLCPNSIKYEWQRQTERHTDEKCVVVDGTKAKRGEKIEEWFEGDARFCSVNYDSFRTEPELYPSKKIDMVVLDECQRIKNHRTKTFKTVMGLKNVKNKLAMTGTPVTGKLEDLFNVIRFIEMDKLGNNMGEFKTRYMEVDYWGTPTSYKNMKHLRYITRSIALRRKKEDTDVDLPDKVFLTYDVSMSGEQRRIYNEMHAYHAAKFKEEEVTAAVVIAAITRLMQITTGPHTIDPSMSPSDSAKVRELDSVLEDVMDNKRKVIVWTRFVTNHVDALLKRYKQYNPLVLNGTLSSAEREQAILDFQDNQSYKLMIANPASGGLGITWTAADTCIFLDKPMQMELIPQAIDRIHRIGQTKSVNVISLVTRGTVDERVEEIVQRKMNLARGVLDEDDFVDKISIADLLHIFGSK